MYLRSVATNKPVACLRGSLRLAHAGKDNSNNSSVTAALRGTGKDLRSWPWLYLHPVEKWTILVDLGRRAPLLLEKSFFFGVAAEKNEKSILAGLMTRLLSGTLQQTSGKAPQVPPTGLESHHRSIAQQLPYCVRLRLCLSFLMWVSSLRHVQDTLARLRLPYATTRRVKSSTVADVFPTRMVERFLDPFTTVAVKMDAELNSTAEQVAAPHAWHIKEEKEMEEEIKSAALGDVSHNRRFDKNCRRNSECARRRRAVRNLKKEVLLSVQGMKAIPSDDDVLASQGKRWSRRARQEALFLFKTYPQKKAFSSDSQSIGCVHSSAFDSLFVTDYEEDEKYHGNYSRFEGCPLDADGRLTSTPIHIVLPSDVEVVDMERYFVMAHAAVLSSLFIEGRTVNFTTNNSLVLDYVNFLFSELIKDGWITASLCMENIRTYVPSWYTAEAIFVLLPPERGKLFSVRQIRDVAQMILQSAPCSVIIEATSPGANGQYTQGLMDEVERLTNEVVTPHTKKHWRVSWVPLTLSTTANCVNEQAKDAINTYQATVNEILRQFYSVTFIYIPSNCWLTPRQVQEWWWDKVPSSIHIVAVNSHYLDTMYYFPQAPFLHKKIGNSFRYHSVRRVLVGKNVYAGREDRLRQWAHRWLFWRWTFSMGFNNRMHVMEKKRILLKRANNVNNDVEYAVDALKLERTVDFLANPNKKTWLALMMAKLFTL